MNFAKRLLPQRVGVVDNDLPKVQLLLEPRSIVVFEEEARLEHCHGIEMDAVQEWALQVRVNAPADQRVDHGHRLSLTFRHKKQARVFFAWKATRNGLGAAGGGLIGRVIVATVSKWTRSKNGLCKRVSMLQWENKSIVGIDSL